MCGRLAGVPVGVGVQREHRRVEHRICDVNVLCKRRFGRRMQRGEVMPSVGLSMVIYTRRDRDGAISRCIPSDRSMYVLVMRVRARTI